MCRLTLLLLALAFTTGLNAQAEWTELPAHNAEDVEVIFVSEKGNLYGTTLYPHRLMLSKDAGHTWIETYRPAEGVIGPYSVKEDLEGEIWMTNGRALYKYNQSARKLE